MVGYCRGGTIEEAPPPIQGLSLPLPRCGQLRTNQELFLSQAASGRLVGTIDVMVDFYWEWESMALLVDQKKGLRHIYLLRLSIKLFQTAFAQTSDSLPPVFPPPQGYPDHIDKL